MMMMMMISKDVGIFPCLTRFLPLDLLLLHWRSLGLVLPVSD